MQTVVSRVVGQHQSLGSDHPSMQRDPDYQRLHHSLQTLHQACQGHDGSAALVVQHAQALAKELNVLHVRLVQRRPRRVPTTPLS